MGINSYVNSCIFYAGLMGEDRRSGELETLQERVNDFNEGNLVIVASTLPLAEVLQSKSDPKIWKFLMECWINQI